MIFSRSLWETPGHIITQHHRLLLKDQYYYSDSGTAIYSITSKVLTNDSTVWGCVEVRDIVHHFYSPQQNSTDTIRDAIEFSIAEYHDGNHRLIETGNSDSFSVFPFSKEYQDTSLFFRYFPSILTDTFSTTIQSQSVNKPENNYRVSFQRSVGLTKVSFYFYPPVLGHDASTNHTLRNYVITSVNNPNEEAFPNNYELFQNYPNPFNPVTTIAFSIPQSQHVELKVYDILGNEIAILVNNFMNIGRHEVEFNGSDLSSGIYFYRLKAGGVIQTKKLVLIK